LPRGTGTGLRGRRRICPHSPHSAVAAIPRATLGLDLEVVLDDRQIDQVQEGIDLALLMGKLLSFICWAKAASGRSGATALTLRSRSNVDCR
jgi:hypothetical protein